METASTVELPPREETPLAAEAVFARLPARHRALAAELIGGKGVFLVVPTRTGIDVGSWLGRSRVCACALADHLLLFAPARNPLALLAKAARLAGKLRLPASPYAQRIPFEQLRESTYNQVTGELVLAPATDARVRRLKVPPLDGHRLLAQIPPARKETRHA